MNLYISNLGDKITDESLRAIFATHGEVGSARIIKDQFSGYSRGFAFIEMPNEDEAITAISKINGAVVDGRSVSVQEARPKTENKGSYPARDRSKKW
jgi:RNA recognition motif-containing protein